jgi:hypothetical protein
MLFKLALSSLVFITLYSCINKLWNSWKQYKILKAFFARRDDKPEIVNLCLLYKWVSWFDLDKEWECLQFAGPLFAVTDFVLRLSAFECEDGDLRLVGGSNDREGRVQVCLLNGWNTVCGRLRAQDQHVLCRQLGYLRNTSSSSKKKLTVLSWNWPCPHNYVIGLSGDEFGAYGCNGQQFFMNNTFCLGTEGRLLECSHYVHDVVNSNCCGIVPAAVVKCTEGGNYACIKCVGSDWGV